MDSFEAARAVFSRIQRVDPDNAHKIVTHILLQQQSEKEMIRLAFGPENLIHSIVTKAKAELGLSSNISSAVHSSASAPSFSPISNPVSISKPQLSLSSPRLAVHNPSPPSSPSIWSVSSSSNHLAPSPDANTSLSYAVLNGSNTRATPFPPPFKRGDSLDGGNLSKSPNFLDQFTEMAMRPGCRSDSLPYPCWEKRNTFEDGQFHRRSCFVNDDFTSGFNYKPRVLCKNSSNIVHGGASSVDSYENPSGSFDAFEHYKQEVIRSKVAQQQRLAAAQYMAGVDSPYSKLNFLPGEAQKSGAAALMLDELHKLNRLRSAGSDFPEMGFGDSAPSSRQIYLTFPADSSFKEEDVSNYFSIYGPVQDVRIPYQQKRMFGFVTFVYAETVQIILAKGNPHFVCDSRVLVKPYKEKAKLSDKKQQQLDRYDFLSCSSPSVLDGEPFEMHVGPRLLHKNQEMLKKKLEQEVHWQQALELQRRRLMNLQRVDLKNHHCQHDFSDGSPPHPADNHGTSLNQNIPPTTNVFPEDALEGNQGSPTASPTKEPQEIVTADSAGSNGIKKDDSDIKLSNDVLGSPSASPTKSAAVDLSILAPKSVKVGNGVTISTSTATTHNMASPKSCLLEIPRFSSEHGAIGM